MSADTNNALTILSEDEQMFRDMVREFAEAEIAPVAAGMDDREEFPWDNAAKMAELGLFGIPWPEEYGAAGMDLMASVIVAEELARVDASHSRDTGGTGLGLAIAKGIVTARGGMTSHAAEPGPMIMPASRKAAIDGIFSRVKITPSAPATSRLTPISLTSEGISPPAAQAGPARNSSRSASGAWMRCAPGARHDDCSMVSPLIPTYGQPLA